MSSYFKANRDYHQIWRARHVFEMSEEEIRKMAFGEQEMIRYPENVSFKEFI
jgi:hypothetical protein